MPLFKVFIFGFDSSERFILKRIATGRWGRMFSRAAATCSSAAGKPNHAGLVRRIAGSTRCTGDTNVRQTMAPHAAQPETNGSEARASEHCVGPQQTRRLWSSGVEGRTQDPAGRAKGFETVAIASRLVGWSVSRRELKGVLWRRCRRSRIPPRLPLAHSSQGLLESLSLAPSLRMFLEEHAMGSGDAFQWPQGSDRCTAQWVA